MEVWLVFYSMWIHGNQLLFRKAVSLYTYLSSSWFSKYYHGLVHFIPGSTDDLDF